MNKKKELFEKPLFKVRWSKWQIACKIWEKERLKNRLEFEYSFYKDKKDIQVKNDSTNYYIRYKDIVYIN
jgi:hypothetical protein